MKRSYCSADGRVPKMQKDMVRASSADDDDRDLRLIHDLRSSAADLFLREQWNEALALYTRLIRLCEDQIPNDDLNDGRDLERMAVYRRTLCIALSSRAETHSRSRDFRAALKDCDRALGIDGSHFKTLMCKGRILLHHFSCYSAALECFQKASLDPQAAGAVDGLTKKCRRFEYLSRTGNFDLSDWVLTGFRGDSLQLAEYIGPVVVRKSDSCGRGLFATRNIEAGTIVLVTRAVAVERGIAMCEEMDEKQQLVMWRRFVDKVMESASKCAATCRQISALQDGEESEAALEAPDMSLFRMDPERRECSDGEVDAGKILSILDANSLVENANSAKVLGMNKNCHGIGLWILPSFVNHSCCPNARRTHVGNHLIMHASRDIKAGEELLFAYFDVMNPLEKRREMAVSWGFRCSCSRCKFEESMRRELRDMEEAGLGSGGVDAGKVVFRLEECMRKLVVRGREKGYLRASFWGAYSETYTNEGLLKRWGRRIPSAEAVAESVAEAVGGDERVLRVVSRNCGGGGGGGGGSGMDGVLKLGRGIYGKIVKKQALKTLLDI